MKTRENSGQGLSPLEDLTRGYIALRRQRWDDAAASFSAPAAKQSLTNLALVLITAVAHFEAGRHDQGGTYLAQAIAAEPDCATWARQVPVLAPFRETPAFLRAVGGKPRAAQAAAPSNSRVHVFRGPRKRATGAWTMDKAYASQLANIEKRTGKSLDALASIIKKSGLTKHGEIRDMLKRDLGMGHGDANTLVHYVLQSDGSGAAAAAGKTTTDVLDEIYAGAKAHLRPVHDRIMSAVEKFGAFEIAPKKGYVSLRRKKQFAMIGPATSTRVEVGLNMKDAEADPRLLQLPAGQMCQYKVKVSEPKDVNEQLIAWIRRAFDAAD
jgi:hypothetical protein